MLKKINQLKRVFNIFFFNRNRLNITSKGVVTFNKLAIANLEYVIAQGWNQVYNYCVEQSVEPRSVFEIESSEPYFILQFFLTRNIVTPTANICDLPVFNMRDWKLSPQQKDIHHHVSLCLGFISLYLLKLHTSNLSGWYTLHYKTHKYFPFPCS